MILTNVFTLLKLNSVFWKGNKTSYNDKKTELQSTNLSIWELTSRKDKLLAVASFLYQIPKDPLLSQYILSFQIKSSCSEPDKDDLSSWKNMILSSFSKLHFIEMNVLPLLIFFLISKTRV